MMVRCGEPLQPSRRLGLQGWRLPTGGCLRKDADGGMGELPTRDQRLSAASDNIGGRRSFVGWVRPGFPKRRGENWRAC